MPAYRILIADDDQFLRDLVRQKLGMLGYQAFLARDGVEAVRRAYETRPDLIILDMKMPEMDGFQTLSRLKADPELAGIPVLMLTAARGEADVRNALRLGAVDYVAKPFQLDAFCERIRRILDARHQAPEPVQVLL
jgi:CheY-like chemotaxis protein